MRRKSYSQNMTPEEWLVVAAWVAAIAGIGSLSLTVLKARELKEILLKFGDVVASYERTVESYKSELSQLKQGKSIDEELKKQELELQQRKQSLEELKAIGGAARYIIEKWTDSEEE